MILTFLLGGVCAHTLKAQGNVYVRAELPYPSGNFVPTVTVYLINNVPSYVSGNNNVNFTNFGIDHNGPSAATATVAFNITSTNQGAPNLQSLVGQGQVNRTFTGLTAAHFPTTPGARYTYQINATFTPQGGGAVINTTTPITLILINGPPGGPVGPPGGGGQMSQQGYRSSVTLLRRFNAKSGRVEVIKNGVFGRFGFLNIKSVSPQNRRKALRNYRYR